MRVLGKCCPLGRLRFHRRWVFAASVLYLLPEDEPRVAPGREEGLAHGTVISFQEGCGTKTLGLKHVSRNKIKLQASTVRRMG
jgi:hypothetical protein